MSPITIVLMVVAIIVIAYLALEPIMIVPVITAVTCIALVCLSGAFVASQLATLGPISHFGNALQLSAYLAFWLLVAFAARAILRNAFRGIRLTIGEAFGGEPS